ncbi:uncharacterized protein LOC129702944 [Leucoraja erinacea]|uniref:uncharacterized protein LOC129702944 n=1 Tax=Leucoraja erinaceus TaxID=7782 RepID=UPI0024570B2B|nr:uncharacterized protein LOC129702944 [Leucoraja erinacea]
MTYIIKAVMFKLCILLFKNQIVAPSKATETVELINATIGGNVLFSVNCTSYMNRSIEWKMNGSITKSIMVHDIAGGHTIFADYEGRVEDFKNCSFLLTNIRLNDTGYYTVTLVDTEGKVITKTKKLFVTANGRKDDHYKHEGNTTKGNKSWKFNAIIIGVSLLGAIVICVTLAYFIWRRLQKNTETDGQDVKRNENQNSYVPEIVYSTYVGAFVNYGKSYQTTSLDQT